MTSGTVGVFETLERSAIERDNTGVSRDAPGVRSGAHTAFNGGVP
jgi:hypothetical protein